MKLKIIHCVNSLSSLSGGVGFSIKTLIENNSNFNHTILTLYDNEPLLNINANVKILRFKRTGPFSLSYSYSLEKYLLELVSTEPDCSIHIHGLWSGLSFSSLKVKNRFRNINLIISPHGMLSHYALKRKLLFKFFYGLLIEKPLLRRADYIHVLNSKEKESLINFTDNKNYKIIPHPQKFKLGLNEISKNWDNKINNEKSLLYIGRLHETKGILEMLTALKVIINSGTTINFRIDIYGFGNKKYIDQIIQLIKNNNLNVKYHGPVFGKKKQQAFLNSHAIILPSQTEGLPMSLIEASSFGLPLFITNECNLDWVNNKLHGFNLKFSLKNIRKLLLNFNNESHANLKTMGLNTLMASKNFCESKKVNKLWKIIYK